MDWRARLAAYLSRRLPSATAVEIVNLRGMPAGASNDTVAIDLRVTSDGATFDVEVVLRPERADGILAPYDVHRQFRVMRALQATAVPVPAVAWYEPNPSILGAPFFLMSRVRGETLPLFWYGSPTPASPPPPPCSLPYHSVDWRALDLGFLSAEPEPVSPLAAEPVPGAPAPSASASASTAGGHTGRVAPRQRARRCPLRPPPRRSQPRQLPVLR